MFVVSRPVTGARADRRAVSALTIAVATANIPFLTEVETLINTERGAMGLDPLILTKALRAAAAGHSVDMGNAENCTHRGTDGSTPAERMLAAGCPVPYGEIVACGFETADTAVAAWMNSSGHRAIILCQSCTTFGAGYHFDPNGFQNYWTVNFGAESLAPTPTGSPATATRTATAIPTSTATATSTASSTPTATLAPMPGDTNCDLARNIVDAQFIVQYDVRSRGPSTSCPLSSGSLFFPGCDVNADSKCNSVDAQTVMRCTVGMSNPLCHQGSQRPEDSVLLSGPTGSVHSLHIAGPSLPQRRLATASLIAGTGKVGPGVSASVPVTLSVAAGNSIGALTAELRYDPQVAQVTACTITSGLFGSCNTAFDVDGVGTDAVRFSVISLSGITGSQWVVTVTFAGKPGLVSSPTFSPLSPFIEVVADLDGHSLSADPLPGQLIWLLPTETPSPVPTASSTPPPATTTSLPTATATATATATVTATETPSPTATVPFTPSAPPAQPCVSGEVFHDQANDGLQQIPSPDYGISGVTVELVEDTDLSGSLSVNDIVVASTSSIQNGRYQLCASDGSYFVRVPAAEFGPVGVLDGFHSSSGNDQAGLPPLPSDDIDGDDNGQDVPDGSAATRLLVLAGNGPTAGSVDLGFALTASPTGLMQLHADIQVLNGRVMIWWSADRAEAVQGLHIDRSRTAEGWQRLTARPLPIDSTRRSWADDAAPEGILHYRLVAMSDTGHPTVVQVLAVDTVRQSLRLWLPFLGQTKTASTTR